MIYREPKNLEELYKKLSGAQLHLKTKDSELDVEYSHVKAPAISMRAPVPVTTSAPLRF